MRPSGQKRVRGLNLLRGLKNLEILNFLSGKIEKYQNEEGRVIGVKNGLGV